jgi:nitric oxide reductase activation protein
LKGIFLFFQSDTKAAAEEAQRAGLNVFAVGIGSAPSQSELLLIAGGDPDRVFNAADFEDLKDILEKLSGEICHPRASRRSRQRLH